MLLLSHLLVLRERPSPCGTATRGMRPHGIGSACASRARAVEGVMAGPHLILTILSQAAKEASGVGRLSATSSNRAGLACAMRANDRVASVARARWLGKAGASGFEHMHNAPRRRPSTYAPAATR